MDSQYIIDEKEPVEEDGVRQIGSGNSFVYLYYYPTYKQYTEFRKEDTWPCRIECSEYSNPIHRIYEQFGYGMPEQLKIGLVIRTNQPKELESAIHQRLDRLPNAPGTGWFRTNPNQVEDVYNAIIKDYS